MTDNIFDIEKLVKKRRDVEVKHKEIDVTKLVDYEEFPLDDVPNLPANSFIYYMNKGGDTHKGFVKMVRKDAEGIKLDIASYLGVNAKSWVVRLSKIEKIWKKKEQILYPTSAQAVAQPTTHMMGGAPTAHMMGGTGATAHHDIDDVREELKALRETINTLKGKILHMDEEQKKIALKLAEIAAKKK